MKRKLALLALALAVLAASGAAAFRKEDKALLTGVNGALQAMQKDGALRRLMEKMAREGY
jgi:hypothetical protein